VPWRRCNVHGSPTDFYFTEFDNVWEFYTTPPTPPNVYWINTSLYEIDWFPEIFVGRLTVSSQQQIDWWFNKIKKYETSPGNGDHLFRMLFTESDGMQNAQRVEALINLDWWPVSMYEKIFSEIPGWNSYPVTDPQGADVINEINTSPYYAWIHVYAHGGYTGSTVSSDGDNFCYGGTNPQGWWISTLDSYVYPPWFRTEPYNGLNCISNVDDKYPIFFSLGCLNFDFTVSEDITPVEGFTSHSQTGGPAALGYSGNSTSPDSPNYHREFLRRIWDDNSYIIGMAFGMSKSSAEITYPTSNYILNFAGSPEMNIWITQPLEFTNISLPLSIPIGGNDNFTVSTGVTSAGVNGEWPIVCIYQEDDGFWEFQETNNSGNATFDIDLSSTSRVWVTANRYDFVPYQWSMIPGLPAPPQNVTCQVTIENHPLISWDESAEPEVQGYNIYKRLYHVNFPNESFFKLNNELLTGTSFEDEGFDVNVQASTTAYYYVTAVDDDPDESEPSETVYNVGHQSQSNAFTDDISMLINKYDGLMAAPNPFNESVQLSFALQKAGRVNISVYDINGRKVVELFDGMVNAKELNNITFNANHLGSGVYFCQLKSNDKISTRKLVYLK